MYLSKEKQRKIQLAFFSTSALFVLYYVFKVITLLIQYPPAREDLLLVLVLAFFASILAILVLEVRKLTHTKSSKETCYFALIVISVFLSVLTIVNFTLRLNIPSPPILAGSIIVSVPLACRMAGYSKRTLKGRVKKLMLNNAVTSLTIVILISMPLIEYNPFVVYRISQRGYVLPLLEFQNTENTTAVNGQTNSSGFYAQILVYENHTFDAKNIVELAVVTWGNESIRLDFYISKFKGNSEFLHQFDFQVVSGSEKTCVANVTNGFVHCNQALITLEPNSTLSFDIRCTVVDSLISPKAVTLCFSVCCRSVTLKIIHVSLIAATY